MSAQDCLPTTQTSTYLARTGRSCVLALTLLVAPFSAAAIAQTNPVTAESIVVAPNLESFVLDNGLQVVVIPDRRAPVVTHMIWYKVGAADEPAGQSGVAHFLEHLMFKGTSNNPDGAFSKMIAARGGQENAFTSLDYTGYFQRVSKEHLGLMMELEADRMGNLVLSDDVVNSERDVVLEERRSRVDSEPGSRLREALNSVTFVNHPYGSPVIGWEHEIEALNKEAALAFYDRFYTPNNAVVVVAGDVDPADVKELAQLSYGQVARRAEPGERVRVAEPPLSGERRVAVSDERVRQESISHTWVVPSWSTAEGKTAEALDIAAYILGGGPTSRLHKSLVLDKKVALSAGAYYSGGALNDGRFGAYASPRPDHTLEDLETLVREEIQNLIENGVTAEEVEKARNSMIASAIYAQDSQTGLARLFGSALTTGSTIEDVQTWPAQVSAVTPNDVVEAARTYLSAQPVVGELRKKTPSASEAALGKPQRSNEEG